MHFIEVEKSVRDKEWSMTDLHSHAHYELYFLLSGKRRFFLKNRMYHIGAPCLIVIPPHTVHKTEGAGFSRVNVNISADGLDAYEGDVLRKLGGKVLPLSSEDAARIFSVLDEAVAVQEENAPTAAAQLHLLFGYLLFILGRTTFLPAAESVESKSDTASPVILKVIHYLTDNYREKITLQDLSERFFISKISLCEKFRRAMNDSVGNYLLRLRISKAKEFLCTTSKGMEEIAALCGFSSAAYMGLIFKEKTGLSPLNYRKLQKTKT